MHHSFVKFFLYLVAFTALISIIDFFLFTLWLKQYYLPVFPYLYLFFFVVTAAIHYILIVASKKKAARFIAYFMGTITLKLMIYLVFLLTYVLLNREKAMLFTLMYASLYICFTTFEVVFLLKHLKKYAH